LGVVGDCVWPRDVGIMSVTTSKWGEDDAVAEVHVPRLDGCKEGGCDHGRGERRA
jgi:hypothetical protein